jgi:hypothetical protein
MEQGIVNVVGCRMFAAANPSFGGSILDSQVASARDFCD